MPEKNEEVKEEDGEAQEEQKVELTQTQYDTLMEQLDRLEELEEKVAERGVRGESEVYDLDTLAKEGLRTEEEDKPSQMPKIDEETDPQEVIKWMFNEIKNNMINPVIQMVLQERIERQIDRESDRHEDFWKYGKEIKALMIENPKMPVSRAYTLAKAENPHKAEKREGEKGKEKEEEGEALPKSREVLRTLPPRKKTPSGEKPSATSQRALEDAPKTIREAIEKAYDDAGVS